MIFSLQPRRAWTIDGFNSDQFSQGFCPPGPSPQWSCANDRVLLQRVHRPRRALGAVGGRERSAHDRAGLPLPWVQRSVWTLRAHHSAHHGWGPRPLQRDMLPKRASRVVIGLLPIGW